ncbi:MAG: hypothetical protein HDS58_04810 [Barnesiella sp.]|nr:hypothetical protein [Barnesiella sp.]
MKRSVSAILLTFLLFVYPSLYAEDAKVVISTPQNTNYVLYAASTGVYLRLDTRDGKIIGVVPSNPKKNRVLNSQSLATDNQPGRFQLHPTDNIWIWLLFDTTNGDTWQLKWSDKDDALRPINIDEEINKS